MAIQMRRGNMVDFNPSKMLPGEFAVAQDQEHLYLCYRPGRVLEIGSAGVILPYVYEAEAWARGTKDGAAVSSSDPQYHNNAKYYSELAKDSADNASASEVNAAASESSAEGHSEDSEAWAVGTTDTSHPAYNNSAKDWAAAASAIVGIGVATYSVPGIVMPDPDTMSIDGTGLLKVDNINIVGKKVVVS